MAVSKWFVAEEQILEDFSCFYSIEWKLINRQLYMVDCAGVDQIEGLTEDFRGNFANGIAKY